MGCGLMKRSGFLRHGTLLATAEAWVNHWPQGYFAEEAAQSLRAEVQDALYHSSSGAG
jgi:hypothetical protein